MRHDAFRPLGISMALGAVYDAAFGVAILAFLAPSAALLGLEVPADPLYLRLDGIFLLILAGIYAAVARDPARHVAIVRVAIAGRTAGFAYFVWARSAGGAPVLTWLAIGDLAFAVAHAALLVGASRRRRSDGDA